MIMMALKRKRVADERGVAALLTLAFMMSVGVAIVITLWAISVASGAFNLLYSVNQSAAYAAVSAVSTGEADSNQMQIDCGDVIAGASCAQTSGAWRAANHVFSFGLQEGNFGLTYDGNSRSGSVKWNIYPFNMDLKQGEVRRELIRRTGSSDIVMIGTLVTNNSCGGALHGGRTIGNNSKNMVNYEMLNNGIGAYAEELFCWQVIERGVKYPPQFQSGVVSQASAEINLIPGCAMAICRANVDVIASASFDQPSPTNNYNDYNPAP